MSIHIAIANAPLKSGPKALCWALLGLSVWKTGSGIRAPMRFIAAAAGMKPSTARATLKKLVELKVVVEERHFEGGYLQGESFKHHLRLDQDALENLAFSSDARQKTSEDPPENCTLPAKKQRAGVSFLAGIYTEAKGTSIPPPHPSGGGGASHSRETEGESKESDPGAFTALVDYGVMIKNSRVLAQQYSHEEVLAGIAWLRTCADTAKSLPAVLVRALEDGTATAFLQRKRKTEEAMAKRAEAQRRAERIDLLFRWTCERSPQLGEEESMRVRRKWAEIRQVFPTPNDAGNSGFCPDEELMSSESDGWVLLGKLHRFARQQSSRAAPLPSPPQPRLDRAAGI